MGESKRLPPLPRKSGRDRKMRKMGERGDCGVVVVPRAAVLIESEKSESGKVCPYVNGAGRNS